MFYEFQNPDSLLADTVSVQQVPEFVHSGRDYLSVFKGSESFLMTQAVNNWYFYFFLALILGYIVARIFLGQILSSAFNASIRYNTTLGMYKDNSQVQNQRDNILYLYYFLSCAFYLLILESYFGIFPHGLSGGLLYLANFGLLFVVFLFRIFLLNLVGILFEKQALLKEYLYHNFAFNKLLGIVFIPINVLLVYTRGTMNEILIYLSIFIIVFMIVMKISRGVIFSFKHRIFSFYLFLYLCALEMVPLILLYKWFTTIL